MLDGRVSRRCAEPDGYAMAALLVAAYSAIKKIKSRANDVLE